MKKYVFLTVGALLGLASCSQDDLNAPVADGTAVDVTFDAVMPDDLATRADGHFYGDGTTAKKLQYAVYSTGTTAKCVKTGETTFPENSLHKEVAIQLVTGETYKIVFWAQEAEATAYNFDMENHTLTVDYQNIKNNSEALDAFYVCKEITVKADELSQTAELRRPFCQVNIATKDLDVVEKTGTLPTQSSVTFSEVPDQMDFFTGTVSMSDPTATPTLFDMADLPTWQSTESAPEGKVVVNGTEYDYLSMTYFLAPENGAVHNVSMEVNNFTDGVRTYNNIPVKRNYRTNIVGDLLTSTTLWDVEIVPAFNKPDYDYIVVDGKEYVAAETAAEVQSAVKAGKPVALTEDVTLSSTSFSGQKFALYTLGTNPVEVNLNGNTLTVTNQQVFYAQGQGAVMNISNGTIVANDTPGYLFELVWSPTVNLTNVDIETNAEAAFLLAYFNGYPNSANVNFDGVKVNGGMYAVFTNASNDQVTPNFNFNNCDLNAYIPVMLSVKSTTTMTDCRLNGEIAGLVMRGGTATLTNCEITQNYLGSAWLMDSTSSYSKHSDVAASTVDTWFKTVFTVGSDGKDYTNNWGSSWYVPAAALVIGNKGNAYKNPTDLTLNNCKVVGHEFPAIYSWNRTDYPVTLTKDAQTTVTGKYYINDVEQ